MVESPIAKHLDHLPLFPLPGTVLFPKMRMPLHIFEARYRRMVRDALEQGLPIAMGNLKPEGAAAVNRPPVYPVLGVGVIDKFREMPDGRFLIELVGRDRVRIIRENDSEMPYRTIQAELVPVAATEPRVSDRALATLRSLLVLMRKSSPDFAFAVTEAIAGRTKPGELSDAIAGVLHVDAHIRQGWLDETDTLARFASVTNLVSTLVIQSQPESDSLN